MPHWPTAKASGPGGERANLLQSGHEQTLVG